MRRYPQALSKTRFDLAVIGGGINGAAAAPAVAQIFARRFGWDDPTRPEAVRRFATLANFGA